MLVRGDDRRIEPVYQYALKVKKDEGCPVISREGAPALLEDDDLGMQQIDWDVPDVARFLSKRPRQRWMTRPLLTPTIMPWMLSTRRASRALSPASRNSTRRAARRRTRLYGSNSVTTLHASLTEFVVVPVASPPRISASETSASRRPCTDTEPSVVMKSKTRSASSVTSPFQDHQSTTNPTRCCGRSWVGRGKGGCRGSRRMESSGSGLSAGGTGLGRGRR